jgi:anti-sigma regulatory factor (Ser/Thr protein kinase)
MNDQNIKDLIREMLHDAPSIASRDVVAASGITQQGVHYHLRQMVDSGELRRVGAGRGTRYERAGLEIRSFATDGLAEDVAWHEIRPLLERVASERALRVLNYGFTEMLNNVIDHSASESAEIRVWITEGRAVVEVRDQGVGAFEKVANGLELGDPLHALQELTKGRVTTDPDHHTGEGIFFTSKMVDLFTLESNGLRWTVDRLRRDWAVGSSDLPVGTRVRLEVALDTEVVPRDIYDQFTGEDFGFSKTRTSVELFGLGTRFVSRSEAKRLAAGLERFEEVTIDFRGVSDVGQAFIDQVFRVWATAHPGTRLVPVNMDPVVERFVRRAALEVGESPSADERSTQRTTDFTWT